MRCLVASLMLLAAALPVSAKCVTATDAADTLAKENPAARVAILTDADASDLRAYFQSQDSIAGEASGFVSVAFPDKLILVPVYGELVCDELPVEAFAGEDRDPIRRHLLRSRARKGLPAPAGWSREWSA